MERLETRLDGPALLKPRIFRDERGFFHESYRRSVFSDLGIEAEFVQDNHSRSSMGVVRGMHFQVGDGAAKLIRCARGAILDVVVDLRLDSPTFGEWEAFKLDDANLHQVYCPVGFAHGFCVLSEVADVMYKQAPCYDAEIERGIAFDDPAIGISWPEDLVLLPSERDSNAPPLSEVKAELPFRMKPGR